MMGPLRDFFMIQITPTAARQIRAMLVEKKTSLADGGLRVRVENGGCAGMQYDVSFDLRKETDQVFHEHEANVLVDLKSLEFIDGSTIDYADGLTSAGFRINNPKAKQTCGCGTSFGA